MWHVSSRSGVATLRTAIHLLLTYLDVSGAPVDAGRGLGGRLVDAPALHVRLVADDHDRRPLVALLLRDYLVPQQLTRASPATRRSRGDGPRDGVVASASLGRGLRPATVASNCLATLVVMWRCSVVIPCVQISRRPETTSGRALVLGLDSGTVLVLGALFMLLPHILVTSLLVHHSIVECLKTIFLCVLRNVVVLLVSMRLEITPGQPCKTA